MKKALAGFIVGIILAGCGAAAAGTGNDTVFGEDRYEEFFKKEGSDKNYLYTVTEQPIPKPNTCNVYTFASERAGAVVCNIDGQAVNGSGSSEFEDEE